MAVDYEFEYGGSMDKLSGYYYNSDGTFFGGDLIVTNGYDQIPKKLMAKAQKRGASLLLNFAVTAITTSSSGVTVTGVDSSATTKSFSADYVIITAPLGVLKAGSIAFSPALSSAKQEAISSIGFGTVNKVVFFYDKAFWTTDVNEYFIEDGTLPANRGKFVDWVDLETPWNQVALMGVSAGKYADAMALMTEAQVVTEAKAKMFAMFPSGQSGVTLRDTFVQRWNLDPYARGSYSFGQVGMKKDAYDTMAEPEGKLLFAGEHTYGEYRGTVHGAYLSGIREARRIIWGG